MSLVSIPINSDGFAVTHRVSAPLFSQKTHGEAIAGQYCCQLPTTIL